MAPDINLRQSSDLQAAICLDEISFFIFLMSFVHIQSIIHSFSCVPISQKTTTCIQPGGQKWCHLQHNKAIVCNYSRRTWEFYDSRQRLLCCCQAESDWYSWSRKEPGGAEALCRNALSDLRSVFSVSVSSMNCCLRGGAMNCGALTQQVAQVDPTPPNTAQLYILLYTPFLQD